MNARARHAAIPLFPTARIQRAWLLFLALALAQPAWAVTYYVATNGNDGNSGTSVSLPFKTIQRAMNVVLPGDAVLIRGGTYREQVESIKGGTAEKPISVSAYPGEIPVIKGSDVVTGWVPDGPKVWKKAGWPHNSQQVFVDFNTRPANSLQQIGMPSQHYAAWEYPAPVGTGRASMTPGSFYYDRATTTLYVYLKDHSDPNRHTMEVSVRRRLFMMHQPHIHLKGIRFRHSSSSAFIQQGAAVEMSAHSVLENCDIQYVDFTGVSMGYLQDGAHVHNCVISNNGNSGISAAGSTNFWVTNVTVKNNNTRNFNTLWHAGGFKGATKTFGTIENSEFANNNGGGIWFDYANGTSPIVIRNNYVHGNGPAEAAIFFEVSNNGLIYNNVVANNRRRGIYLSAANNTRVYNNTIYGTTERAGIEVAGMPRGASTLTNNAIRNNIVSHGSSVYDLYILPANGTTIVGNTSDHNNFYRPSGAISLRYSATFQDLGVWRTATGMDLNSLNANALFVAPGVSAAGYAVMTGSPVINAGANLVSVVSDDYLKVFRPSGTAVDMGAFEFNQSTATTDTIAPVVMLNSAVATTSTSLTISASATDNIGVTGMQLYIGGVLKTSSTSGQLTYGWSNPASGSHEIRITASDAAKNTGTATATLTVQ